jgi:hypothetical protein
MAKGNAIFVMRVTFQLPAQLSAKCVALGSLLDEALVCVMNVALDNQLKQKDQRSARTVLPVNLQNDSEAVNAKNALQARLHLQKDLCCVRNVKKG